MGAGTEAYGKLRIIDEESPLPADPVATVAEIHPALRLYRISSFIAAPPGAAFFLRPVV
jgi:hypothetical protein